MTEYLIQLVLVEVNIHHVAREVAKAESGVRTGLRGWHSVLNVWNGLWYRKHRVSAERREVSDLVSGLRKEVVECTRNGRLRTQGCGALLGAINRGLSQVLRRELQLG
jgi:hypothetical protein